MSVINKMLQDLEQRQQPAIQPRVKTMAPQPRAAGSSRYLWLVLLLTALVLLGWLWHGENGQLQAQTPADNQQPVADTTAGLASTVSTQQVDKPGELATNTSAEPAKIMAALLTEPTELTASAKAARVEPPVHLHAKVEPPAKVPPRQLIISAKPELQPVATAQATVDKQPLSVEAQQHNMQLRANASEAAGDTSGAIVIWQQIVAQQPTEPNGYLSLARLWLKQQQIISASQVLLQARQNGVQSAEINLQLAQLAVRQGQWQQALEFLPDQFELAAEPEYFGFKATVLQQLQQYDAALSWYQRLAQLQPDQGRWSLGAALVSEQLGQPQQAYQHYQQAWQYRQALSASSHDFIQQRLKATEP